jgi:hypothetical protein
MPPEHFEHQLNKNRAAHAADRSSRRPIAQISAARLRCMTRLGLSRSIIALPMSGVAMVTICCNQRRLQAPSAPINLIGIWAQA